MRGILNFFQQNPILGIVIAISLLLLNIGIWILRNPAPMPVDLPSSDASQRQLEIPALPETGGEGQNIDSLQSTVLNFNATSMSEASKLSPRELDKAIAEAEKGSEVWCDLMLVKADNAWTEEETMLFAKACI